MKYTPENITTLSKNEVFVFGSNEAGNHAGGAARYALDNFGARMGCAFGESGSAFAIPTMSATFERLTLAEIGKYIASFIARTRINADKRYLVTPIGCGIAGFTPEEIAPLFFMHAIPPNVILPKSFYEADKLNSPVF